MSHRISRLCCRISRKMRVRSRCVTRWKTRCCISRIHGTDSEPGLPSLQCPPQPNWWKRAAAGSADTDVAHPFMIMKARRRGKGRQSSLAALLTAVQIPPESSCTISIVLGQADNMKQAAAFAEYRDQGGRMPRFSPPGSGGHHRETEDESGRVETDRYADWLKYRHWRNESGLGAILSKWSVRLSRSAVDCVNLVWVDPLIARSQIVLHASQFIEVTWCTGSIGCRTAAPFAARTYASDNLLRLAWAAVEYVEMTGDTSILDEGAPYLAAEQPLAPLPAENTGGIHPASFIAHRFRVPTLCVP